MSLGPKPTNAPVAAPTSTKAFCPIGSGIDPAAAGGVKHLASPPIAAREIKERLAALTALASTAPKRARDVRPPVIPLGRFQKHPG
ncbi:hypothetical protein SBV1_1180019 [Verrucomicrobia bacterium]|nr:hypothetical protein SBV1_1180019 [Verrucomicrobiota bacterium]